MEYGNFFAFSRRDFLNRTGLGFGGLALSAMLQADGFAAKSSQPLDGKPHFPPEAKSVCERVRAGGLETILLVAPTTPRQRRIEIGKLSSGFIYYLSVTGITGERADLPHELADGVRDMKSLTDRPVCVGFGVSTARHLAQLSGVADGAIVGSAFVRRMKQNQEKGADEIAAAVGAYCRELLSDVR